MSQVFYGSICLTDLVELAKKKHSAFTKGKNGKIYCNVNVWLNDVEDKYGNIMSCQLNPAKERRDSDGRPYIGNMKEGSASTPLNNRDVSNLDTGWDAPSGKGNHDANSITEPIDDLPF